jgi:hypothetical protein
MLVAAVVVQRVGQQPLVVAAAAEMVQILQQLAVPVPIILAVAVAVLTLAMPAQADQDL